VKLRLDHIVFGAADLGCGVEFMARALGVAPLGGGKHQLFGTHNALWRLEGKNYPLYLEVIAIDPDSAPPQLPRWFALDDPAVQARLSPQPRLLSFVAGTSNIEAARKQLKSDPGKPVRVSRENLKWRISVPDNGALIADGALPYLIEWESESPVNSMPGQGLEIRSVAGNRLGGLDMSWPCSQRYSKAPLEVVLGGKGGQEASFSCLNKTIFR